MQDFDVVILGGGVTGLTAAQELSKKGLKVCILEKNPKLGGLLQSVKAGKTYVETYYYHFFTTDKHLIEKIKELKLEKRIEWVYTSTAFLFDEGIYELSAPQHIFSFEPLNLREKLDFIKLMVKIKMKKEVNDLDRMKAKDWIIKNSSRSLYKKMFEPLLKSKFGKNAEKVSAAWFVERINLRGERSLKGEKLGYIKGGFKVFVDALERDIKKRGVTILTSVEVKRIRKKDKFEIDLNEKKISTKCIISTIPLHFLKRFKLFDKNFEKKIGSVEYQRSLCILMSLKKPLTKYYWVNVMKDSRIGAIIEHTNFQPLSLYDGHLVYLAQYPDNEDIVWKMREEEIWKKYFSELRKLFPVKEEDINWYKISKSFYAGVIYKKGFKKKLLSYETPVKGFFIGGLFNMYPERSTNQAVKIGGELAEKACEYLRSLNF